MKIQATPEGWMRQRVLHAAKPKEIIYGPKFLGPMMADARSGAGAWVGNTLVPSGSAVVTVSTTEVNSDTLFFLGGLGVGNVTSAHAFEVKSISPGNFFMLGTQDGVALVRDSNIHWMMLKTS
jgi:hypothetical protein